MTELETTDPLATPPRWPGVVGVTGIVLAILMFIDNLDDLVIPLLWSPDDWRGLLGPGEAELVMGLMPPMSWMVPISLIGMALAVVLFLGSLRLRRLSVDGDCFRPRGRALLFRAPGRDAIATCVDVGVQIFDGDGVVVWELTVELIRVGWRGRWKLRSIVGFSDPGFSFPVAGFDTEMYRLSGVALVVGDDGLLSPFRAVSFRTLAP